MVELLDEDVLMEIEVKFGKGRSDSVIVHNHDDPTELAMVRITSLRIRINQHLIFLSGFCESPWS